MMAPGEYPQERINFVVGVHQGLRELDEGKGIPHDKIKSGTSMPLKGFAAGGSVMGGKLNGERFLASKPERGDVSDSRGSNVTVIQNNQFGTNISRNELANAAKMAQEQAKSDILRSVRLGGAFARSGG